MAQKKRSTRNKRLKPLKKRLNVKTGNIPDNTSLDDYLRKERKLFEQLDREAKNTSVSELFTDKTNKLDAKEQKDFFKKALRKVKATPLQKAKFVSRMTASDFLDRTLGLGELAQDFYVDSLTDLLISTFDDGVKLGKRLRRKTTVEKKKKKK